MKSGTSLSAILSWIKHNWQLLAILGVILLTVRIRLTNDEDFRLSIGTDDTPGYLSASQVPLGSWEFFTSLRPFTLPLVLKLMEPKNGYRLDVISRPAADESIYRRKTQQGFDRVVLTQLAFSILGWGALALAVSRHLENPVLKILSVALILLFAFSQPVADWDSVIDSSSLTFSLLAFSFAIWIEIAFWFPRGVEGGKVKAGVLIAPWLAATILFAFVRDSNQYILPISALFVLSLLLLRPMRSKVWPISILALIMVLVFGFGLLTARAGMRWKVPLLHAYEHFIFPYEYRMAYFQVTYDMPEPNTLAFKAWYDRQAPQAYILFLANHPGIVAAELYSNMETFFSENLQPYFHGNKKDLSRLQLERIGNILHPISSVVLYVDLIMLGGLCGITLKTRARRPLTWLWLAGWWLLSASLMLFVNYFFDAWGVIRHVVYYIQMYRLFFWVYLLVIIDLLLVYPLPPQAETAN